MALKYQPQVGSVLICDFKGMVEPEMVKKRPVVVIARNRHNNKLVTIVPLSTTEPLSLKEFHYALPVNPMPGNEQVPCWAKGDMLMTVSTGRLDRIKVRTMGERSYVVPRLSNIDLDHIRRAVLHGIGMSHLVR